MRPRLLPTLALWAPVCCPPQRGLWAGDGYAGRVELGWVAGFEGASGVLTYVSGLAPWSERAEMAVEAARREAVSD